jgi:hypothetical protein
MVIFPPHFITELWPTPTKVTNQPPTLRRAQGPLRYREDRALRDFDVAMRFDPKNALALYARGLTLLKKGDAEAGRADIAAAKAINPDVAEQYNDSESAVR